MAIWGRITTLIAGIGISRAASVVVEPALEPERQDAWLKSLAAILEPPELARLVASGLMDEDTAGGFAKRNGFDTDKFAALVQLELHGATIAQALEIWNRHPTLAGLVDHALAKAQIEPQYWDYIKDLAQIRIPADLLAFAHQRGIVPNPEDPISGQLLIPVSAPTDSAVDLNGGPSPIRQEPIDIDVLAEFAATGWDFQRAAVNARARGLPPAPGELLQLVNRGVISVTEYYAGIGEGDTRNEWRDYLLELRRRLLTPNEYAELFLRGWIVEEDLTAGAALSGMTAADAQLLYDLHGRPLNIHQVSQAIARGGVYDDPMKPDVAGTLRAELVSQLQADGYSLTNAHAYVDAVQESNVRSQFYGMALANRYLFPPFFQTVNLLGKGLIEPATATDWLKKDGYDPEAIDTVVTALSGTKTATTDTHVKSATTSAVTAIRKSYIAGNLPPDQATALLVQAGITTANAASILAQWNIIAQVEGVNIDTAGGEPH